MIEVNVTKEIRINFGEGLGKSLSLVEAKFLHESLGRALVENKTSETVLEKAFRLVREQGACINWGKVEVNRHNLCPLAQIAEHNGGGACYGDWEDVSENTTDILTKLGWDEKVYNTFQTFLGYQVNGGTNDWKTAEEVKTAVYGE